MRGGIAPQPLPSEARANDAAFHVNRDRERTLRSAGSHRLNKSGRRSRAASAGSLRAASAGSMRSALSSASAFSINSRPSSGDLLRAYNTELLKPQTPWPTRDSTGGTFDPSFQVQDPPVVARRTPRAELRDLRRHGGAALAHVLPRRHLQQRQQRLQLLQLRHRPRRRRACLCLVALLRLRRPALHVFQYPHHPRRDPRKVHRSAHLRPHEVLQQLRRRAKLSAEHGVLQP